MQDVARKRLSDAECDALVAKPPPAKAPIDAPAEFTIIDADSGAPVACCITAPVDLATAATQAFREVPRSSVKRAAGIRTRSNVYGWVAASAMMRRPTPALTAWARNYPVQHEALDAFSAYAWAKLDALGYAPEAIALRDRVDPGYRMGGTGWTSGIANDTVPLHFHHDRNNHPDSWSAMLCCRAGTTGGDLYIADYDTVIPIRDKSILLFPGVKTVHGVTPITQRIRAGFRYTFVSYTVRSFVDLPSPAETIAAAANRRTELEETLLERQRQTGALR